MIDNTIIAVAVACFVCILIGFIIGVVIGATTPDEESKPFIHETPFICETHVMTTLCAAFDIPEETLAKFPKEARRYADCEISKRLGIEAMKYSEIREITDPINGVVTVSARIRVAAERRKDG